MKKEIKTLIIVVFAIILTIAACFFINKTKKTNKMGPGAFEKPVSIVTVRSSVAQKETLIDYVITNGEVESQSAIDVFPSMNGKISSVNVMLGSHVKKGDVIAYVDPSEPGSNYAKSPILAPISGSIVSNPSKVGTKVSTATAFTMIGDIENLQITAPVPERYVAVLKPGLKAEISLEAYPDVIFNASISRVSPVVDKATRTKQIILNFDKKDSRINAGMFAKIKLYTSKYEGFVVVPKDAVVQDDATSYLFVVNDNETVSKRVVKTGKSVDAKIQITDNLVQGERIVIEGLLSLSDGAKVNDISVKKDIPAGENMPDENLPPDAKNFSKEEKAGGKKNNSKVTK